MAVQTAISVHNNQPNDLFYYRRKQQAMRSPTQAARYLSIPKSDGHGGCQSSINLAHSQVLLGSAKRLFSHTKLFYPLPFGSQSRTN